MKKKIYYWTPFIDNVATIKASFNSSLFFRKFFGNKFIVKTLNVFGEWDDYKNKKNFDIIDLIQNRIIKKLPFRGFINSRLKYLLIGLFSLYHLFKLLRKDKPDFIIVHLISYIPLSLLILFNFNTKFILRISGLPKLNFFRRTFWKLTNKKIYHVTCPTKITYDSFIKNKIFSPDKLSILRDPAIIIDEIKKKKYENIKFKKIEKKYFFIAIGRLTYQKNFLFLIKNIKSILIHNNYHLVIVGEGEERFILEKYINDNNLNKNIHLLGFVENIFPLLKKAKAFISTSRWEDPGFVLIEAASMNLPIISSNCLSGPKEFLSGNLRGYSFKENDSESFKNAVNTFLNESPNEVRKKLFEAKKYIKNYTGFSHVNFLYKILN